MIVIILLLFLLLVLFDLYERIGKTGRLLKTIPGPKTWPIVGNITNFFLPPHKLFKYQRSLFRNYGDVSQLHGMGIAIVHINNPEDIQILLSTPKYNYKEFPYTYLTSWLHEGLLTSNGMKWHQRRKLLVKTFNSSIIKSFYTTFVKETDNVVKQIHEEIGKTRTDLVPIINTVTLNIICETAMGKFEKYMKLSASNYSKVLHVIGDCFAKRIGRAWLKIESLYQCTNIARNQKKAVKRLHEFTNEVINKRREYFYDKNTNNIFEEDIDSFESNVKLAMLDFLLKNEKSGLINHDGIREEVDTFLFAGYETTALAMTYLIMTLANEPEIQQKIYEELCEICGDSDNPPTIDDLNKLKYLECCIKETLRLYPSVPLIGRHLKEDIQLGGFTVPRNTACFVGIYDLHRRADLYPEPDRFIPERFLPENCAKRHPYAYLPFSGGLRVCLGQKFSYLEMKTIISGLLRKFRFEPVTKPSDLVFKSDIVLRTVNPIYVKFCLR